MDKKKQLAELAKKRQTSQWAGYSNIGDYQKGIHECEWVSPYTKSADNVNAEVMVFLQDWSSDKSSLSPSKDDVVRLGYTPSLPTNKNLIYLLQKHFGLMLKEIYATNIFPFIKNGPMNAPIPQKDMVRAAKEFGLPQLEIINPKIAICLGISTFNALRTVCGIAKVKTLTEGIDKTFHYGESVIFCQAHTGALGKINRNRGGVDRVSQDWFKMASYYKVAQNNQM